MGGQARRFNWTWWALCKGLPADVFVPEPQHGSGKRPLVVEALCPVCPVRAQCEQYGRETRSVGWWGGVYLTHRDALRRPPREKRVVIVSRRRRPKLTVAEIAAIRERWAAGGMLQREIAATYGVSRTTVTALVRGIAQAATETTLEDGSEVVPVGRPAP